MKKKRAVISLIVFVLILGLLGYTAVFGVGSDKSGSASSIKLRSEERRVGKECRY